MNSDSINLWGKTNFLQGLKIENSYLDQNWRPKQTYPIFENYLRFINTNIYTSFVFELSDLRAEYPENVSNRFIEDKKTFYFLLKSSPTGTPVYRNPFVLFSDNTEQDITPIYSHSSVLFNWIDYQTSWSSNKDINFLYIDNYRLFIVKSKDTLDDNMKIQICNLNRRSTIKPLFNENIVYVIGKNYTINGVSHVFENIKYQAFYDLEEINISTDEFVNIVYFEKK